MAEAARSIAPADEFREHVSSPRMRELYDYWLGLRRGRGMPSRADLDPADIRRMLPNLMLIDVLRDPLRFRYRLIGTRVVGATGEDRTGRFFDEIPFFRKHPTVAEHYLMVAATSQPFHSLEPFTDREKGTPYEAERLLLPLSSDGGRVSMMLAYFDFQTGPYSGR